MDLGVLFFHIHEYKFDFLKNLLPSHDYDSIEIMD